MGSKCWSLMRRFPEDIERYVCSNSRTSEPSHNDDVVMRFPVMSVMRGLGDIALIGVILPAFPLLPITGANVSMVYAAEKSELLDINTATADQLKALPRIDDAHSEKITKGRPYARKDELARRRFSREQRMSRLSTILLRSRNGVHYP
jgi:competence protein ComEA